MSGTKPFTESKECSIGIVNMYKSTWYLRYFASTCTFWWWRALVIVFVQTWMLFRVHGVECRSTHRESTRFYRDSLDTRSPGIPHSRVCLGFMEVSKFRCWSTHLDPWSVWPQQERTCILCKLHQHHVYINDATVFLCTERISQVV